MPLRTVFFWLHLTAGVVAGAVILLMSITGVALTYERQMIAWSDREFKSTPREGIDRMPVEQLIEEFRQQSPGQEPTALVVESDPAEPVAVSVGQATVYVDAYSGRVLGQANQGMRRTMSQLRAWHRWLAVEGEGRTSARAITGWSNVAFLFIVASGIYMWFPRRWTAQSFKGVSFFKSGVRGKARDFNWHNVIGIWSAAALLIVVASAVPISFPWGNNLVYRMVGEEPPARGGGPGRGGENAEGRGRAGGPEPGRQAGARPAAGGERRERPASIEGLSPLLARARQQEAGWRTINLRLPASPDAPVVFAIDRGDGGQPHLRSTLTLTRAGEVMSYENFGSLSTGRRIRNVMRFAHTGEVLGLFGQTVAGVVSAGGVVLVWTGIALALRRLVAWARRRRSVELEPAAENPAA
jgi:uncharacterized iron-regulated membrane protein